MKRRVAAWLTVIALTFVGVAAAGTVNLGGTGANTNCGGGGFLAINTQVGTGNPTIVPSGDWTLKTWSVAGGMGYLFGSNAAQQAPQASPPQPYPPYPYQAPPAALPRHSLAPVMHDLGIAPSCCGGP